MKHLYKVLLLLTPLVLSSCSSNSSSSSTSSITSEKETSEDISIEESEESSSFFVPVVSALNPLNEPYIANQFYLNHIGDIYNTWKSYQGHGQTIAVIDVGFKYDHPDFYYEDGTSKVSDKSAYFYSSGKEVKKKLGVTNLHNTITGHDYSDDHGTFCAGVAAAGINGKGVIGIAPLAELLLLRTDGQVPSINAAFNYAVECGARVVSISIGSYADYLGDLNYDSTTKANLKTDFDTAISDAREAGTVVISAAGNGRDGMTRATEFTYPGGTTGVIGVGGLASNESSELWSGSSYNASNTSSKVFCDVFAPSEYMFGCCDYNSSKYDGIEGNWKGTSFAAPIVAGMAALYFEKNPTATVDEFEEDLYASSHTFTPTGLSKNNIANGRVDVGELLDTTLKDNVTVIAKDSEDLYAYLFNSVTGAQAKAWPGTKCTASSNKYSISVDTSKYDSVIFNNNKGDSTAQSATLLASSFVDGHVYNLTSPTSIGSNVYLGKYNKN